MTMKVCNTYSQSSMVSRVLRVRALQGEVQLIDLPGRPVLALTRSEAIQLCNALISELKQPEPYIPKLSLWRRLVDKLKRLTRGQEARRQEEAMRARAQRLLDGGYS